MIELVTKRSIILKIFVQSKLQQQWKELSLNTFNKIMNKTQKTDSKSYSGELMSGLGTSLIFL